MPATTPVCSSCGAQKPLIKSYGICTACLLKR